MKSTGFDGKFRQFGGASMVAVSHNTRKSFARKSLEDKIEHFNDRQNQYHLVSSEVAYIERADSKTIWVHFSPNLDQPYTRADFFMEHPEFAHHAMKQGTLPETLQDDPEFLEKLENKDFESVTPVKTSGGDDELKFPIYAIKLGTTEWYGADFDLNVITDRYDQLGKLVDDQGAVGKRSRSIPDDRQDIQSIWQLEYDPVESN